VSTDCLTGNDEKLAGFITNREKLLNILVTGGAGYIGGTVALQLVSAGHNVLIYDNFCHGHRELVPAGTRLVEGDLADRQLLERVLRDERVDGVMHFAALIEAGESMKQPEIYFRNNTASTLTLLEAMLAAKVNRLVFSSTAAVYGEPERTPIEETAALAPTNAYGESKLLVEQMLIWLNRIHGLRYASLRYFNVAGAVEGRGEAHEPESHLIPLVLDVALRRRQSIKIFGKDYPTPDGTCIRDYVHVGDLADAHILAMEALATRPRLIYNIGNGMGFSVREVVESARRVTGHPIPVIDEPRRPGDPAVLVASSKRIIEELGWKPRYSSLDEIVRSAWLWHQQRYGAKN
jgi:UDP-glucose 4-epimerase